MAYTAGNNITSSDITNLKNRVKNEMGRRDNANSGPLNSFNGNFSQSAAAGETAKASHYNETIGYIAKIAAISGLASSVSAGATIYAIQAGVDRLGTNEDRSVNHKQDNSTDCSSNCTGLCYNSCYGGCRGCTGCSGNCGNECNQWCGGSCWIDYCYCNASYY